jgi:glucokinase
VVAADLTAILPSPVISVMRRGIRSFGRLMRGFDGPEGVLIGVDVGGTTMSGGLVAADGAVLSVVETSPQRDGPGTALDTLLGTVGELLLRAEARGLQVEGIGVGLPGIVDVDTGTLGRASASCRSQERLLVELIWAKTGIDAFVDNDVNALALGEWRYGVARGATRGARPRPDSGAR